MIVQLMVEDGRERRIEQSRPLTYTIEGFCVHVKISRQGFYDTYFCSKSYKAVCERIREECEVDARRKFETGQLPGKLAGLWMSKYGYCNKPTAPDTEGDVPKFEDI